MVVLFNNPCVNHRRQRKAEGGGRKAEGRGLKGLAVRTEKVQSSSMKRSVDLDEDLATEVDKTSSLIREKPATVIRLAIRAGLPVVANRFQSPRPEGYFADDYPLPKDRLELEARMSKVGTGPDR